MTAKTPFRPAFDSLGDRILPAGLTAELNMLVSGYELVVMATPGNDTIAVHRTGAVAGVYYITAPAERLTVDGLDTIKIYDRNHVATGEILAGGIDLSQKVVKSVFVKCGGGDDVVTFDTAATPDGHKPVTTPVTVNGGDGNDRLSGAAGPTTRSGGEGNDVLTAGPGATTLDGDGGQDVLVGGSGKTTFDGGAGFDSYYDPHRATAPAFAQGTNAGDSPTTLDDLRQSDTGIAGATLAAVGAMLRTAVNAGHDFTQDVSYLGDSTYAVYVGGHAPENLHTVAFDGHWTDNDASPVHADGDVWALLVTRAWYQQLGIDGAVFHAKAEWQASGALDEARAAADLTGRPATTTAFLTVSSSPSGVAAVVGIDPAAVQVALSAGQSVVARSRGTTTVAGLTPNQAFAVQDVSLVNGEYLVQVFDPSKHDGGQAVVVTMSWNDFLASFQSVTVA